MNCIPIRLISDRSRVRLEAIFTGICILLLVAPIGQRLSAQNHLHDVERTVAIADVHGAYEAFESILLETELVDSDLNWIGAKAHLVVVGDVLDRGAGSRRAMELIQHLENQAAISGGRVILVLGNHEVMNLVGDLRYVTAAEFGAYRDMEDEADREAAFLRFRSLEARTDSNEPALRDEFDKNYPPGFFGHRVAFSSSGWFGRWLLGKPVIIAIDDTAFAHAGIANRYNGVSLEEINRVASDTLNEYVSVMEQLIASSVLFPEDAFYEHPGKLENYLAVRREGGVAVPGDVVNRAGQLTELHTAPLFGGDSLTWYRGNATCSPAIERTRLEAALGALGVARIVVGHTPTPNHRVLSRFDGQVIRADTGMQASYYQGQPAAVVISGSSVEVRYPLARLTAVPTPQVRRVAPRPGMISDDELESILSSVGPADERHGEDGALLLTLVREGVTFNARFDPAADNLSLPQVAAYRLDRLLGFDLVPVAVAVKLEGRRGVIRLNQGELIQEGTPKAESVHQLANCPLSDQYNLMYLFDMLAHNEGRGPTDIRYTPASGSVVLTGNRNSFGTQRNVPQYLRQVPLNLTSGLRQRLATLTEETLQAELADVLSDRQRRAILARRDSILKLEASN